MKAPFNIRRAEPREAAELTALCLVSKQSNGYDDAFMALCVDELRVTPEDIRDHLIWVAEREALLGCVTLKPDGDGKSGEVTSFFVHPDAKRQGVGRALWAAVLTEARAEQLRHLHLDADPAAVPFYEAVGFRVTGEVPSGSVPGRSLPYMERDI